MTNNQDLWIVTGDNHDYDAMSQWVVGVFTSKKRAQTAVRNDQKAYRRWRGKDGPGPLLAKYEITKVSLNIPEPWGNNYGEVS